MTKSVTDDDDQVDNSYGIVCREVAMRDDPSLGHFDVKATEARRRYVEGVMRRADRNAHGHIAQALRLKALDDMATFVATIGGAGIMAFSAVLLGSDTRQHGIEVIVAVIGGLITLVGVWQAVWQPGQRSRLHKEWSNRFATIEDECKLYVAGESERLMTDLMSDQMAAQRDADLVGNRYWRRLGTRT